MSHRLTEWYEVPPDRKLNVTDAGILDALQRQAPGTIADDLAGDFATIPEVEACHRIAGEGDYLLKIRASDTGDLERLVRIVQGTRHVYRTETDVVFSTPFEWRPLPTRPTEKPSRSDPATEA